MGMMDKIVNSGIGKVIKWTALGATVISGAGAGQQVMSYQKSRDAGADVFELDKSDADRPEINRETMEKLRNPSKLMEGVTFDTLDGEGMKDFMSGGEKNAKILGPDTVTQKTSEADSAAQKGNVSVTRIDGGSDQDVEIKLPGETFQKFISTVEGTDTAKQIIGKVVSTGDSKVEQTIESPTGVKGSILARVKVPLPTGDFPMLGMQIPKLGSADFYKAPLNSDNYVTVNPTGTDLGSVVEEELPLAVSYDVNSNAPNVKVKSEIFHPGKLPAPPSNDKPYVLLAGVRTTVNAEESNFTVKGKISVDMDLDGKATQGKIDQLRQIMSDKSSSPEQVKRASAQILSLQNRARNAGELGRRLDKAGFRDTLENVMKDQDTDISIQVKMPKKDPLVKAAHYFWLGPDKDNDGMADLYITRDIDTSGFQQVKMGRMDTKASVQGEKNVEGGLAKIGNKVAEKQIHKEMKKAALSMEDEIKDKVRETVEHVTASAIPGFEELANTYLSSFVEGHANSSVEINEPGVKADINFQVKGFQVINHGGRPTAVIKIDVGNDNLQNIKTNFTERLERTNRAVEQGEASAAVDGHLLNSMLRDRSEGGAVDWNFMFQKMKSQGPVEEISFNRDKDGNTVYPKIIMKDGKPVVNLDLTLKLKGKGILEGTGDIAKTASGALDSGVGFVTDNTLGQLGEGGKAVGSVVRAPFKVIDFLVGGAKDVVDSTIGRVVDAAPKFLTGSDISVNVTVPLNVACQDGKLIVEGQSKGLKITDSRHNSEIKAEELIPTRALVSGLAKLVATGAPEDSVGANGKPLVRQEISLKDKGIDLEGIQFEEGNQDKFGDTVPHIRLNISPNEKMADTVEYVILKSMR